MRSNEKKARRSCIERCLNSDPEMTVPTIQERCGGSKALVNQIRKEMGLGKAPTSEFITEAEYRGLQKKGGKSCKMLFGKKGRDGD